MVVEEADMVERAACMEAVLVGASEQAVAAAMLAHAESPPVKTVPLVV